MAKLKVLASPPDQAPTEVQRPETRRDRTRAALIRAGEALMSSRSVDAVSIDEIVEAAGVAKGTFYNHFPDKEVLQHDVLQAIRADIRNHIRVVNATIDDPARRVVRAFCTTLLYAQNNPSRGNFLIRTSMAFRLVDDIVNAGLVQDVGTGLGRGRFPIATTESGALLMLGITQAAMVQTLDLQTGFPLTSRAQQMGAMLLRGLGLPYDEAESIAAQEADTIMCRHGRPSQDIGQT